MALAKLQKLRPGWKGGSVPEDLLASTMFTDLPSFVGAWGVFNATT